MNDTTMKLLNLINEGKTVNEISETLKLSNKAIFCRLNMLDIILKDYIILTVILSTQMVPIWLGIMRRTMGLI